MSFDKKYAIQECVYLGKLWHEQLHRVISWNINEFMMQYFMGAMLLVWEHVASLLVKNVGRIKWNMFHTYFLLGETYEKEMFDNVGFANSLKPYFDNNNLTKEILLEKIKEHLANGIQ